MTLPANMDQDAFDAAVHLVGRTGATSIEIGYLHDDVPVDEAGWYAHAQYRGARITAEDHKGPVEAAEALARRLLDGGQCTHCRQKITLANPGADASTCRWTRIADRWKRGCEA